MAVPTLIQHVGTAANSLGVFPLTNSDNYKIRLPNSVGAGNCLILGFTYDVGNSITSISDNVNGTWAAPTVTTTSSADTKASVVVMPNAGSGLTTITINLASGNRNFQAEVSEFKNIATTSPGGGSSGVADDTGPDVACGSFTPTNNDANGGNLIWCYFASNPPDGADFPTGISPGTNFTLLSADISGKTGMVLPHAAQYYVQATSASINPGATFTGDTTFGYHCIAVALQAATAGTSQPSGIWIKRMIAQSPESSIAGSYTIQFPCTGNLIVLIFDVVAAGSSYGHITNITDSQSNSYTERESTNGSAIWHTANSTPDTNLVITLTFQNSDTRWSVFCYDIEGAAASPYDIFAGPDAISCSSVTHVDNAPSITPTEVGLTLAYCGLGIGPSTGFYTGYPSGAVFVAPTYDNETDDDYLTNAAGLGILYHQNTNQQNWNWTISSEADNQAYASAICFKAAAGGGGEPGTITSTITL